MALLDGIRYDFAQYPARQMVALGVADDLLHELVNVENFLTLDALAGARYERRRFPRWFPSCQLLPAPGTPARRHQGAGISCVRLHGGACTGFDDRDDDIDDKKVNDKKVNDKKVNDKKVNDKKVNDKKRVNVLKTVLCVMCASRPCWSTSGSTGLHFYRYEHHQIMLVKGDDMAEGASAIVPCVTSTCARFWLLPIIQPIKSGAAPTS